MTATTPPSVSDMDVRELIRTYDTVSAGIDSPFSDMVVLALKDLLQLRQSATAVVQRERETVRQLAEMTTRAVNAEQLVKDLETTISHMSMEGHL